MSIYTLSQALELAKSHGSEYSNGAWVLLSLASIHSPYLSNSDKVAELENLLFFAQRCIGAGCEPRVRPLPGQDGQVARLAASDQVDQVEGTPNAVFVDGVECCPHCHSDNLNDAGENFGLSVWECRSCGRGCAASEQFQ